MYVDCLYAPVKRDLISEKVAIYVMLGINKDGQKDVLGIWINENESATFWTEVFEEIKERGVEEILFISLDGLSGLSEALLKVLYLRIKDLEKSWSKGTKKLRKCKTSINRIIR